MQSALRVALRFLQLIEETSESTTPAMRRLVEASKDEESWRTELRSVISAAYAEVLGDLDLEGGTQAQLDAALRERGNVKGSSLTKASRFYQSAAEEAGVQLSPFFTKASRRSPTNGSGQQRRTKPIRKKRRAEPRLELPEGVRKYPIPMPSGTLEVLVPEAAQIDEIEDAITYLLLLLRKTAGGESEE